MATGAVHYHPFPGPVSHTFTVGAAQPIPLGTKMTLAA